MYFDYMTTPIGTLEVCASNTGISRVEFIDPADVKVAKGNALTQTGLEQLQEYFAGKRTVFDLPLDQKGTDFQKAVWTCLCQIPFGETCAYGDIANGVNRPKAVRAVGAANGKNPIAIIVPCHRVIGANKTLTGYAGGMDRKAWLLQHEGATFKA